MASGGAAQGGGRLRAYTRLATALVGCISAHRLYPEDPDQPAMQQAIERAQQAIRLAVTAGPARLEIRSRTVYTDAGPLPAGDRINDLVTSCLDRRVELLLVRAVPSPRELVAFAKVLSIPPNELLEGRGVDGHLEAVGVSSIRAREFHPGEEVDDITADLEPELAELWDKLQRPESLASGMIVSGMPRDPAAAAQQVYDQFASLAATLPDDLVGREGVYRLVRRVVDHLPPAVRREFFATVVSRVGDEDFAARYAGHLTDAEMAQAIVDLDRLGGPEPDELVARLTDRGDRAAGLLTMIRELRGSDPATGEAAPGDAERAAELGLGVALRPEATQETIDQLGDELLATTAGDVQVLRDLFPHGDQDEHTLGLLALYDYLDVETDETRRHDVLEVWAESLVATLGDPEADEREVRRLLDAGHFGEDDEVGTLAGAAVHTALDPAATRTLLDATVPDPDGTDPVADRLEPLGEIGLDAVLALLAIEEEAGRRARLVAIAAELLDDPERLRDWALDERWYVARNVASILARRGKDDALPVLSRLVGHDHPTVRKEVARALPACGGGRSVRDLQRLALDADAEVAGTAVGVLGGLTTDGAARALGEVARSTDSDQLREATLDALGAHASAVASEELKELSSWSRPRQRWRVRRQAKRRLRARS